MLIVAQDYRLPIPGHPEWLASSDGHIYRTNGERVPEYRKELGESRLRVSCQAHGYDSVAKLAWEAFFGIVPPGFAVVHQNDEITDNRPANLRVVRSAGSHSNRSHRKLLTAQQKIEVHRQLDAGMAKTRIAFSFGISPRCVRYHAKSCRCHRGSSTTLLL